MRERLLVIVCAAICFAAIFSAGYWTGYRHTRLVFIADQDLLRMSEVALYGDLEVTKGEFRMFGGHIQGNLIVDKGATLNLEDVMIDGTLPDRVCNTKE